MRIRDIEKAKKHTTLTATKPKAGSKLQQALKGGGARSITRRVEEQLLKLAETEPAELVDAVRDRLENSKLSFKRAVAAAKKASK